MPFKTNYRQERAQRTRTRESKQQEKLLRRKEASDRRKALRETVAGVESENGTPAAEASIKPRDE